MDTESLTSTTISLLSPLVLKPWFLIVGFLWDQLRVNQLVPSKTIDPDSRCFTLQQ